MKYFGKPAGMWAVFGGSFRRELVRCFGLSGQSAYGRRGRRRRSTGSSSGVCPSLKRLTGS